MFSSSLLKLICFSIFVDIILIIQGAPGDVGLRGERGRPGDRVSTVKKY